MRDRNEICSYCGESHPEHGDICPRYEEHQVQQRKADALREEAAKARRRGDDLTATQLEEQAAEYENT